MSLITTIIDGIAPNPSSGLGGANEGHIQGFQDDIINGVAGGVADKAGGQCLVTENSPLGMSVLVADGVVYIPNADYIANLATATKFYRVVIKDEDPVTIPSNTSGSDCQHGLDVVIDKDTVPNEYGSNVATLVVTLGTPGAGAPAIPDNAYRLAEVEVVDSETQIENVSILDTRTQITIDTDVLPSTTVYTTETQTLTNKTLTSPKVGTAILDANGNEVIKTPATTSAVNEITVTNSATGNAVQIGATGDDTNINLKLEAKGTGAILDKNDEALSPNYSMARQALTNGNFDVWQRNTAFGSFNDDTYCADRWIVLSDGNTTWTAGRSTIVPSTKSSYSLYLTNETANKQVGAVQVIEGINTAKLIGQSVTFSFKAKTIADHTIGKLRAAVLAWTGTVDAVTSDVVGTWAGNGTNPTLATNWVYESTPADLTLTTDFQEFTVNATLDQAGTTNLAVFIWVDDTTIAAADSIRIAQVQLCAGDVALPFQPKSFEEELRACMRYYEKSYDYSVAPLTALSSPGLIMGKVASNTIAATEGYGRVFYKVKKRVVVTPTIYPWTTPTNTGRVSTSVGGGDLGATSGDVVYAGDDGFDVRNGSGGTLTTDGLAVIFHYTADAEL